MIFSELSLKTFASTISLLESSSGLSLDYLSRKRTYLIDHSSNEMDQQRYEILINS